MITRRMFLKQFVRANLGVWLYLLAPIPTEKLSTLATDIRRLSNDPCWLDPYWLEVLSRGVSYIPEEVKVDISGWDKHITKEKAYAALKIALEQNERVLSGEIPPSEKNMDTIISYNKTAQFLLENVEGKYIINPVFPEVTYREDPARARMLHDLSIFILNNTLSSIDDQFAGFSNLDLALLRSAESYLREAIKTNQNAVALSPARFKGAIIRNIANAYNNLGIVLSFLGDVRQAYRMYEKALELTPDDTDILNNVEAIEKNASYIRQGPLRQDLSK
ncbi:MAG: tetratricopeptide repeat protein [Desulfobacterales bacterium]|nr:tetratricopeptide repeat protein [Desulfobacterales bacterium]